MSGPADITFIPPGKLRCVITDRLRDDTPEENVRQRVARSLIDDYGYNREDIGVEFTVHVGGSRKRVDLAVFPPSVEHRPETISIIVECKRPDIRPAHESNGIGQLKSYMSSCLNCRFGMWVGMELQVWERIDTPSGGREYLARIHRWTRMDGVRTLEGGLEVTKAMVRARLG